VTSVHEKELEADRRRNLEDVIKHARWEAEAARRLGRRWFELRDEWLIKAHEADKEMWEDARVREALVKAILAKDRVPRASRTQYSKAYQTTQKSKG